ncbi:uncharacterized protein DC041_0005438 [Schistosoma bovis]|uniref:Uncharacterized protein n=1 Tax=Schistosoma bovis TaxID=6184 RepID=A0A430Q575_SCHBO|nr:uncharacterized protein DC041_0005438 [Schistosoma bovis]
MPKIEYIGRPSLHFYGKLLSEIAKNLKNRAKGRVVIKETETAEFKEPCYYILKNVVPLMSDKVSHIFNNMLLSMRTAYFSSSNLRPLTGKSSPSFILEDTDQQSDETTHFGMDVLSFDSYTSRSQMVYINSKSSPLLDNKSSVRIQIQSL